MSTSDDDWETAELAPVKAKPSNKTGSLAANPTNLRAGANEFQPSTSTQPQRPKTENAEAGPSRTITRLASRPSQPVAPGSEMEAKPDMGNLSMNDSNSPAILAATPIGLVKRDEADGKKSVWAPTPIGAPGDGSGRGGSSHFPQLGSGGGGGGLAGGETQDAEEDDWFQAGRPITNRQIWDNANASSRPAIVNSPQVLPTPGVTILRRSTASGQGAGPGSGRRSGGTQTPPKTIEEREEEYRLARERIFGAGGGGAGASGSSAGSATAQAGDVPTQEVKTGKGKGKTKSGTTSASARSTPAPSPPLGPTPTQIGSAATSTATLATGLASGTNSPSGIGSRTDKGTGRSKSGGGGERKRGPAHSGGAMPVLAPPYAGSRGPNSLNSTYGQIQQPSGSTQGQQPVLVRQPRGPGEGAGFGGNMGSMPSMPPAQNATGGVYGYGDPGAAYMGYGNMGLPPAGPPSIASPQHGSGMGDHGQYGYQALGSSGGGYAAYDQAAFNGYGGASASGHGTGYEAGAGGRSGWTR